MTTFRATLAGATTVHQAETDVLDAGRATARWAMTDYLVPSPRSGQRPFDGHDHYLEDYQRVDGMWKIARLELTRLMLDHPAFTLVPRG